jgi:membrane protease YdiL (CAAX protease family)
MRADLYAAWPDGARRTWGVAAVALTVLGYVLSSFPLVIGVGVYTAILQMRDGADPLAVQAALQTATLPVLMPLLLAQFVVWMGATWLWMRLFERRSLASAGLDLNFASLPRYLGGLLLGLVLLVVIAVTAGLLGGLEDAPGALDMGAEATPEGVLQALSRPGVVMALVFAAMVFLVQGGAEEVVFRGWLMSTLSARWGLRAAVLVSSAAFMMFHVHVFVSGLWFGVAALAGIGMMGLVFALLSLLTRSVWEAVAAHGAFNAAAVTAPTVGVLAADPELDINAAFAQVFNSATGMAGPDAVSLGPETFAQALGAGMVAALLAVLVVRGRAARRN